MTNNLNLTPKQRDGIGKKFEWYINNHSILNSIEFVSWLNENTMEEECVHRWITMNYSKGIKCVDCGYIYPQLSE